MPNEIIYHPSLHNAKHSEEYYEAEKELATLEERKQSLADERQAKEKKVESLKKSISEKKARKEKITEQTKIAKNIKHNRIVQHAKEAVRAEEIKQIEKKITRLKKKLENNTDKKKTKKTEKELKKAESDLYDIQNRVSGHSPDKDKRTLASSEKLLTDIADAFDIQDKKEEIPDTALFHANTPIIGKIEREQSGDSDKGDTISEKELAHIAMGGDPISSIESGKEFVTFLNTGEATPEILASIAKKESLEIPLTAEEKTIAKFHRESIDAFIEKENIGNETDTVTISESFISLSDISRHVPDFEKLPDGQQNLIREAILDKLYSYIQESADEKLAEKMSSSGILGRIWTGARKNFLVAGYKKEMLAKIESNTDDLQADFLKTFGAEIANVINESGLEGYTSSREGAGIIGEYVPRNIAEENTELAGLVDDFNHQATEFARMPYEWGLPTASKSQQKVFNEKKALFDSQKSTLLEKLGETLGEEEAALVISNTETLTKTMSFLASHPDASARLRQIAKTPKGLQALKDTVTERGGYMVGGYLSRKALIGTAIGGMWFLAAPIVGAGIGAWRGRDRAVAKLKEQDRAGRAGHRATGSTAIGMGQVDRHIERLQKYSAELGAETDPVKQQMLWQELKVRIDFMETKLSLGQINFGEEKGRFTKQYEFMRALQEASTAYDIHANPQIIGAYEKASENGVLHDVRTLIDTMGSKNQIAVKENRKSFVRRQAFYSAFYGALFAGASATVAHYVHEFNWGGGSKTGTKLPVENTLKPREILPVQDSTTALKDSTILDGAKDHLNDIPIPENSPSSTAIENIEIAVTKGTGGGQAIFDFKHSKSFETLPDYAKKFFDRDIWSVAKDLKLMVDGEKESALIQEGAKFGVTADGKIFLSNPSDQLHPHILGHFEKDAFVPDDVKLSYMDTDHSGASHSFVDQKGTLHSPESAIDTHSRTPEVDHLPVNEMVGDTVKPERPFIRMSDNRIISEGQDLYEAQTADSLLAKSPSVRTIDNSNFTPDELKLVTKNADASFNRTLDTYFGKHNLLGGVLTPGATTPEWLSNRTLPANTFMAHRPSDLQPNYGNFLSALQKLAATLGASYDVSTKDMNIEQYARFLFELEAKNQIVESHN